MAVTESDPIGGIISYHLEFRTVSATPKKGFNLISFRQKGTKQNSYSKFSFIS